MKGRHTAQGLSQPAPVAGAFLEALCLVRSFCEPLVRERHAQSAGPFAIRARGQRVFGSALPCAKLSPAFGARTGRALQDCCAHAKGEANEVPMVAEPGACALCQWLSRLRFHALLATKPLAPRSCHEWQSDRFAIGLARSSLAVRAPCAHPRRSNGKVLGQALPKTRRPQARWGKVSDNH